MGSSGYTDPIVIDVEYTDMHIQAAAISHQIPGILCIKKKKQLSFAGACALKRLLNVLYLFAY